METTSTIKRLIDVFSAIFVGEKILLSFLPKLLGPKANEGEKTKIGKMN